MAQTTQTAGTSLANLLAPGVVIIVVLAMVVPIPPMLLDLLLSVDIGLAVVLMMRVKLLTAPDSSRGFLLRRRCVVSSRFR